MAKDLPAEVSDEELARMHAAGELPKARVRTPSRTLFDPTTEDHYRSTHESRSDVASSPVGGETPREAMASWEAKARESRSKVPEYYAPDVPPTPGRSSDGPPQWERVLKAWRALGETGDVSNEATFLARARDMGAKLTPGQAELADAYAEYRRIDSEGFQAEQAAEGMDRSAKEIEDTFTETETTGAGDPTRPTRSRTYSTLPRDEEEAKAHRESAAKKALEK